MSLATDSIFIEAISSSDELTQTVGGRVYGTAIPLPDEDLDNAPVPYVIVTFDGLNNDQNTKDDPYESDCDHVQIGIEVAAPSLETLHGLTQLVRETVHTYFTGHETHVGGYQMTADGIQWDQQKPCYWQVLRYQCEVEH